MQSPCGSKDYRPVALTSHIMKTLERLFLEQLQPPGPTTLGPLATVLSATQGSTREYLLYLPLHSLYNRLQLLQVSPVIYKSSQMTQQWLVVSVGTMKFECTGLLYGNFVTWCGLNHLELQVTKTKELVVDLRRRTRMPVIPATIQGWTYAEEADMFLSMLLTLGFLLSCSTLIQCSVFIDQPTAIQVLQSSTRRRRANSFALEEMLPGNLERECYEERCSKEEAAEIFQTHETTMEFWYRYKNLNPCQINPCLNGAICTQDREDFLCLCPPRFHGKTCDSEVLECRYRNGGCLQYCQDLAGGAGVQCGCPDGFKLETDGKSCTPTVEFPCGRQRMTAFYYSRSLLDLSEDSNLTLAMDMLLDHNMTNREVHENNTTEPSEESMATNSTSGETGGNQTELGGQVKEDYSPRIVGGNLESRGGSPWQVLIHRSDGSGFCGGTLVSDRWVVSAAHCFEDSADHITIGDYDKKRPDLGEQTIKIQQIIIHPHFHTYTFDSDIALLYLAKPVIRCPTAIPACLPDPHLSGYLLRDNTKGVVTGWGATQYLGSSSRFLRKVTLPVVSYQECSASTEQVITDNMFCAGYLDASMDACSGDSGGPFVVHYRGTWYLTGIVSWGEKCATRGKYGVYTRLGNFLSWIKDTMQKVDRNGTLNG
ncbi:coagulation factor VII [Anableps anableps]